MGDQALRRNVVLVEADTRGAHVERPDGLAGWEPLEPRNAHLDHEAPVRLEMFGSILEARDLLVLRRWVHDRVENEVERRRALAEVVLGHGRTPSKASRERVPTPACARRSQSRLAHGDGLLRIPERHRDDSRRPWPPLALDVQLGFQLRQADRHPCVADVLLESG